MTDARSAGEATPVLDHDGLERLREQLGTETVREAFAAFTSQFRRVLPELEAALREQDLFGVERAAHRLKGSSRTIGAPALASRLEALELAARAGSPAGSETPGDLEAELELVEAHFGRLLDGWLGR